ncbi:MAG: ABC transporter permease [Kiloniellales bacterium]|nr:ABC transporter permease [Kiloniellales bacterium]
MALETAVEQGGAEAPRGIEVRQQDGGAVLVLSGNWLIDSGIFSSAQLFDKQPSARDARAFTIDASGLAEWDSSLIVFLVEIKKACDAGGKTLDLSGLPEGARRLVDLALAVPEREGARRKERMAGLVEVVGREVLNGLKSSGEMLAFLGQTIMAFGKALTGRARYRFSDVFLMLDECGPEALPIVTLISFLVGMILAFVGLVQLQQFGADIFVANLVTISMVREMGAMMTAIIMSGRTGAAFAAQLGTMEVNDEIAAYRTIGISPIEFLVLPRMLALIMAVPLLALYANVVGILGGAIVTVSLTDVSLLQFYNQSVGSAGLGDWLGGTFKAAVYGVIIAIAGCLRGMQCKKSAAAVGEAATSAVVLAIVFIIVAQATLTIVYTILDI